MRKNKKKQAAPARGKVNIRRRVLAVGCFLLVFSAVIVGRLTQLTLFFDDRVEEFSERQRFGSINLHLPRGVIYDRNLNEFAVSVKLRSVYANPRKIGDAGEAARKLAGLLERGGEERRKVERKLQRIFRKAHDKHFVWVRRKVAPETYAGVKAADLPGVGFVKESKRFYPKRDVAAKIVGFCGIDNQGLYGIEYKYDKVIHPVNSRSRVRKDAFGRPISMPDEYSVAEAAAPYDLALTIDERIQYVAEKALERRVAQTRARGGVAIVMDPWNGDIIAMAEQPRFNPNNFARYSAGSWKSNAVSMAVEPGSTFKIFVAAAALEDRLVYPGDLIDCENGRYTVGGKTFREALNKRYGKMPVIDVITHSSNVGAIKLAERLGPERLRESLTMFGFGERTNLDLPGESRGLLRTVDNWSATSLPSISFGQEVAVTPIQMAAGVSVFANGGKLVRPRLVKSFLRNGEVVRDAGTEVVRRVISQPTALAVREMMRKVVTEGTGRMASVEGYDVAGKTGTAQKIDPVTRTYSDEKYLSSFVGLFPTQNPRLVIVVMIDEPEGVVWGGYVAGPVFAEIASRAGRILRIPANGAKIYEIDWGKMTTLDEPKQEVRPGAGGRAASLSGGAGARWRFV